MPMIKCIDCGKEISTRTQACPHCGCPTEQTIETRQKEFVAKYKETHTCKQCGNNNYVPLEQPDGTMIFMCGKCANEEEAVPLPEELRTMQTNTTPHGSTKPIAPPSKTSGTIHQPTCPYCGSTKLKKIGIGSRMLSIGTLGLAGSKIGKQWHCKSCNSNF